MINQSNSIINIPQSNKGKSTSDEQTISRQSATYYHHEAIERLRDETEYDVNTGLINTKHADTRIQQRGIKNEWIQLVLEYGDEKFQHTKNTISVSLKKHGIKKIKRCFGNSVDINKLRRLYLVLTHDNVLITCAYR